MNSFIVTTGDDSAIAVELQKNDRPFTINSSATIQAALVNKSRTTRLTNVVSSIETTPGSDWSKSLIVIVFPSSETTTLAQEREVELEVQVDDGGKLTWHIPGIEIVKGHIS